MFELLREKQLYENWILAVLPLMAASTSLGAGLLLSVITALALLLSSLAVFALKAFLTEKINVPKSEYFLPFQIDELIKKGEKQVEVLVAEDKWYGMTYKEDKPVVKAAISEMTKNGQYDGI